MRFRTACIVLSIAVAGCGGGPDDAVEIAPVSGVLTVGGEPAPNMTVAFYPESGGRPATGTTNAEGKFTLTTYNTGDGAPVGTNKVAVTSATSGKEYGASGPPMPGMPGYEAWMKEQQTGLDPKYSNPEKSGLLYTVTSEGFTNLEIKIP